MLTHYLTPRCTARYKEQGDPPLSMMLYIDGSLDYLDAWRITGMCLSRDAQTNHDVQHGQERHSTVST